MSAKERQLLAALRADFNGRLRVGYFGDATALWDDGEKVESRLISSLRKKGLITIDRTGFVRPA